MDPQLVDHLLVAAVSFVVVVVTTPVVKRIAPAIGAVKVPSERHIHANADP
jgi:UDP-GlcNAc:undecaprenyl-phosphate/decaprenyl-phosphate GlcNAc-1-phosphate transferase